MREAVCFSFLMLTLATPVRAVTLEFDFLEPALTNTWTSYSIPLTADVGWIDRDTGTAPGMAQMQAYLADITLFEISMDRQAQFFIDNVDFAGLAQSDFTSPQCTTDGWAVTGFDSISCNSVIGNPPGSVNNASLPADFQAPAKFLGDLSAAYGGLLTFDLYRNAFSLNDFDTATITLVSAVPLPAGVWLFAGALGVLSSRRRRAGASAGAASPATGLPDPARS